MRSVFTAEDGVRRCWWCAGSEDYQHYHDNEWGYPVADDHRLFEKICLEGFQAGLSWLTVLRKRRRFRELFSDFDFDRVARFTESDVDRLLGDSTIIRHRKKIESAINNARRAQELREEFGSLAKYFWRFEPPKGERPVRCTRTTIAAMAQTESSRRLAKDLKRRGWTFVGPTTAYAFMQAMGLVNDHVDGCEYRGQVAEARRAFPRP